jgi:hypothetical protein
MIIDSLSEFCDNEAVGGSTGRRLVGDVVPLGSAVPNLGIGAQMYLVIRVSAAFTSAGSATVDFEFSSDAAAAIATDGSATVHASTGAIALTDLDAIGDTIAILPLPARATYEDYLGIVANVGTAALTAGSVDAFITPTPDNWKAYPGAK